MTTTTEFTEADLPELPMLTVVGTDGTKAGLDSLIMGYTMRDMRAYALAAVATYHEKLTEQQPVFEVGFGWLDDATKYPRGTKLYATPMLQDKPDGFIHPDNVRRLQSGETVAFRKKPYEHDGGGLPVYVGAKPQANESEAVNALHALVMLLDQGCDTPGALGHVDFVNAIARARAVLAGEPGAQPEQPDYKAAAEQARAFGAPSIAAALDPQDEQPKKAQAMDEREEFEVWLRSIKHPVLPLWQNGIPYGDGQMQRLWGYWQARAALAQAQASAPENIRDGAPYEDPAFEALAREHDVWGRASSALCAVFWRAGQAQTSGKAAPSDEQIRAIAVCDGGLLQDDDSAAWTASDPALLKFARALLERVRQCVTSSCSATALRRCWRYV